jgi:hypothetical protein
LRYVCNAAADPDRAMLIAALFAAALFMENLDSTIIVTGLPQMARSFSTDAVGLNIGVPADIISRSLSYGCSPISRNGNKSVAPGCFNPWAATTAAQSGKKAHDDYDSHECPVPPGDNATRRDCLHLR